MWKCPQCETFNDDARLACIVCECAHTEKIPLSTSDATSYKGILHISGSEPVSTANKEEAFSSYISYISSKSPNIEKKRHRWIGVLIAVIFLLGGVVVAYMQSH